MRFIHRLLERRVQRRIIRFFAAQIFLHHIFIHLHDLIENRRMAAPHGIEVTLAIGVQQALDDRFASARWEIDGQALRPEHGANLIDQSRQIQVRQIDLVDDDRARQVARSRRLHHPPCHQFDAALGVDDDRHRLHGGQASQCRADQIG
jgi:hypothetical protein